MTPRIARRQYGEDVLHPLMLEGVNEEVYKKVVVSTALLHYCTFLRE